MHHAEGDVIRARAEKLASPRPLQAWLARVRDSNARSIAILALQTFIRLSLIKRSTYTPFSSK